MKNKTYPIYIIILFTVITLCVSGVLYIESKIPKTAFVNTNMLYEKFELKSELETKITEVQEQRKAILDSVTKDLTQMSIRLQSQAELNEAQMDAFKKKRQNLIEQQEQFAQSNQSMVQNFSDQIWKQLNQYIKDYGSQQGYTYIFGADGSGTLMNAADEMDITEEVMVYINQRYKGSN